MDSQNDTEIADIEPTSSSDTRASPTQTLSTPSASTCTGPSAAAIHVSAPARKPAKLAKRKHKHRNLGDSPPSYLDQTPLEILAEILSYCTSPRDILALARCSKLYCSTLVNNPATEFIWRKARARCVPEPIPHPTPNFTEASYAAFLFDKGKCEDLKDWLPRLESTNYAIGVPSLMVSPGKFWARDSDWKRAVDEWNKVQLIPERLDAYKREKAALTNKLPVIQEHCQRLLVWRDNRQARIKDITASNEVRAKTFANREGWRTYDLLSTSYNVLHTSKIHSLEVVTDQDFKLIRDTAEKEIIAIMEQRVRREKEAAYRQRRGDVEAHYNRLKSSEKKQVLPSLQEFRNLSVMKVLVNKSTSGDLGIANELKNSKLVDALLKDNIEKWVDGAKAALAGVLGFPGWKSASKKKLHPVERLTARFRCKKCDKVSKKYSEEGCLDFAGACEHVCPHLSTQQRAKETWSADRFEADVQAISTVEKILALHKIAAESPDSTTALLNSMVTCLACPAPISMNFRTATRHCRRHSEPQWSLEVGCVSNPLEIGVTGRLLKTSDDAVRQRALKIYGCRHCCAVPGAVEGAGGSATDASGSVEKRTARAAQKMVANKTRLYGFDGLKSHVKEKHGIICIGDEDFYQQKDNAAH
ncbi:uncharacterized protein FIBRA_01636 [Fibroporia radiculosa]|uniref:F-box domain-containing protein n=1 Tax=Fibroporia radiculosa TaxID=599839 RepID=J4G136_9APHY|nr:uncharacterized protein FIBRA_01636 [Fibroporia radiculosa]CCL99618.1 predicted protein [Fibroporia radiculosa]